VPGRGGPGFDGRGRFVPLWCNGPFWRFFDRADLIEGIAAGRFEALEKMAGARPI